MQDTTTPQNFVLYGCDLWSIVAEMTCSTPNELASELKRHNSFMAFPESTEWAYVAALAFHGFPARILNGAENETFVLLSAPVLPYYRLTGGNISHDLPEYFTLEQHLEQLSAQVR